MSWNHHLFEVSWESCNKVGGIHTVLATKALELTARLGSHYVVIGPALLDGAHEDEFEEEVGFDAFKQDCRDAGTPVRVGHWRVPGRPRAILVGFSGLYEAKDEILGRLWREYRVDSLHGQWDYLEPVLFGLAAGMVIQRWCETFLEGGRGIAVAQFHEWMTGSGILHLKSRMPSIATVFTTHATVLGRAIASGGHLPAEGLLGRTPEEAARDHHVVAKHSMESTCAREADVFTTVSALTAAEATVLLGRAPSPVLPNGIDIGGYAEVTAGTTREAARGILSEFASRFLGEDVGTTRLALISGRYEVHNKGVDLFLDALAQLAKQPGPPIIAVLALPAGASGITPALRARLAMPLDEALRTGVAVGTVTHELHDPDHDPIQTRAHLLGLTNAPGDRVRILQVPIYLRASDDLFGRSYEDLLQGFDLGCFPSYYEPWGYTPMEALAAGVPTITSDCAGFGLYAEDLGLTRADGVHVLARAGRADSDALGDLVAELETWLAGQPVDAATCIESARHYSWSKLIEHYGRAFELAIDSARARTMDSGLPPSLPLARTGAPPAPPSARPKLAHFEVAASLPLELLPLRRLAANYWWSWNPDAMALFEELSPHGWRRSGANPYLLLQQVWGCDVQARLADASYMERLARVSARFDAYLADTTPEVDVDVSRTIIYMSAEFAIHESLRIYSGGLGVLAGDHLKSASDLGLPLVAVGLFYRKGYMRQEINLEGRQVALEERNEPSELPIERVRDAAGLPVCVSIKMPSGPLSVQAWRARIGRIDLILLDTDLPENHPDERSITHALYSGALEHRLRQEVVLGRGGIKVLTAMGIEPSVLHLNEGHAAFAGVEWISTLMHTSGLSFDEARLLVRASTVFTTHTPVPAGHDRFGEDLVRTYFSHVGTYLQLDWQAFLDLGRGGDGHGDADFNMTFLAMNLAGRVNGVSRIHGAVSRRLLAGVWPALLEREVPVSSVTNGVHLSTWVQPELARELGAGDRAVRPADFAHGVANLSDGQLWGVRQKARGKLIGTLRERIEQHGIRRGVRPAILRSALDGLDPNALYIGFARRFAPYKRAALLFQDVGRLAAILARADRPVRILIAGKAHPNDGRGQELLQTIADLCRSPALLGKVLLLEDYDMHLARTMLHGVDVWLNTPTRGDEASGTSGMKAAANGALNLSVPDGWWPEGYDGTNGWSLAEGRSYPNQERQDELDAAELYKLLESEIAPAFFERDAEGLPYEWLRRMRRSLETLPTIFNTDRMVGDYLEFAYRDLGAARARLAANDQVGARDAAAELRRLRKGLASLVVLGSHIGPLEEPHAGDDVFAQLDVLLGDLAPEDVVVELVLEHPGTLETLTLAAVPQEEGLTSFVGTHRLTLAGRFSGGIRLRPRALDLFSSAQAGLIMWA